MAKIGFILSVSTCVLTATCIFFVADKLAMVYSNDKEVIRLMEQTIRLTCVLYAVGGAGWCSMNILEAMSKNKIKGIINVITAWFGYVPASVYFMTGDNHKMLRVSAVSCIFVVGIVVEAFRATALWGIVFCTDWQKACMEAQKRNEKYDEMAKDEEEMEKDDGNHGDLEYVCLDKLEDGDKKKDESEVENENKNDLVGDDGNALKCVLLDSSQAEAATAV